MELPIDILNQLPFGISIQTPDRTVLYENKKMKEWFGIHTTKKCYERWIYLGKEDICHDCPGHVTTIDHKPHFVIRDTQDREGQPLHLKISHYPITSIPGEIIKYVEIIEEIDGSETELLVQLETSQWIDLIYFALVKIKGELGESSYFTELVPFLDDVDKGAYFHKLAVLWANLLEEDQLWDQGLFGPLPLFDSDNYHCFTYVFRNKKDHNMLLIMVPRQFNQFQTNLNDLDEYFESILDFEEISSALDKQEISFDSMREDIAELLQ